MPNFIKKELSELSFNPFTKIDSEWMLVTAGNKKSYNTMTASWGAMGVLWNKYTVTCYIRPQRYTHEFIDREEYFSISFYEDSFRSALALCGRVSGRDCDKAHDANLTPVFTHEAPFFKEASLVFICKKIHTQKIDPDGFHDPDIEMNYDNHDYHTMVIGEIVGVYEKSFK